jgi:hypothetical protein
MSRDAQNTDKRSVRSPRPTEHNLLTRLFAPVDVAALVYFRILFGGIMLAYVWQYLANGWVDQYYIRPAVHFTYYGFDWVRPWPGIGMLLHFYLLAALAVCLILGLFYRVAAILFFAGFTYVFLLEKALHQNHYYLVCLVSSIMVFVPAHRTFSLDALMQITRRGNSAPAWTLWLLRLLIAIPYFYGGISKLNYDWLHGEPVRIWLSRRTDLPLIGGYFEEEWMVYLVTYWGLFFDLLVVPLLLWQRTRVVAFVAAVLFHLMNAALWDIDIFPWFMIGATALFFKPDWPRRALRLPAAQPDSPLPESLTRKHKWTAACLAVGIVVQLLLPFYHFLYPGNVLWTGEGYLFSWHMMLRDTVAGARFEATNGATGETADIDIERYLSSKQAVGLGRDPDMLLQFSHFLADELRRQGEGDVEIRAVALVSLNGRKPQLIVDPRLNLAAQARSWRSQPWILPLREPLREKHWDVPISQWERVLGL